MRFKTITINGKGRGTGLGFPTVNMQVSPELIVGMREGIYAARIYVNGEKYNGALFYGPVPVFGETEKSLEVYLVDALDFYIGPGIDIEFELVKYIRPVQDFSSIELMVLQMKKDVENVKVALSL